MMSSSVDDTLTQLEISNTAVYLLFKPCLRVWYMMCTYYFDYKNNILLSVKPPLYTFHYQSPQKNTMPAFSNHVTKKCTESFNGLFNNAGSVSLVSYNIYTNMRYGAFNYFKIY